MLPWSVPMADRYPTSTFELEETLSWMKALPRMEAHVFDGQNWIFPTYSAPYDAQTFMDAFSSRDLVTWTKHPRVLEAAGVKWARRAVWAPSIIRKDDWYYLFFGANDIQNDQQVGGIGVAPVADVGMARRGEVSRIPRARPADSSIRPACSSASRW